MLIWLNSVFTAWRNRKGPARSGETALVQLGLCQVWIPIRSLEKWRRLRAEPRDAHSRREIVLARRGEPRIMCHVHLPSPSVTAEARHAWEHVPVLGRVLVTPTVRPIPNGSVDRMSAGQLACPGGGGSVEPATEVEVDRFFAIRVSWREAYSGAVCKSSAQRQPRAFTAG
eukprot:scaffold15141_cov101-Isochrysis_galbana.AAC.5